MSDLASKLETTETTEGRARCRLKQHLEGKQGYRVLAEDKQGPLRVCVRPGDKVFLWKRIGREAFDLQLAVNWSRS